MKTTIMTKIRFVMLMAFLAIGLSVWSQSAHIEKLSISTQLFLDELAGRISLDAPTPSIKGSNGEILDPNVRPYQRPIASPEVVKGVTCISSFIRMTDESVIPELEALGVIIESRFDGGLVTSLIPVDKIEQVAALEGVILVEVSGVMYPTTDNARRATNVDDVLALSSDALNAGLSQVYDGSGVILGVIDTGIDFQHIAFKDKNGNSRIKGLYCCTTSDTPDYNWTGSGTLPTTDNSEGEHGSHTSSIAGGSSVIVNGTTVTVTDDHANATYGGMAPGADLYLAGINTLYQTRIANAFQEMFDYATEQDKPLVVSNSYGSTSGPHLGTASYASVINQYFGDDYPNHIAVFSAGNEAGRAYASEGGGCHVYGTASSSSPLSTILRSHVYSNRDGGYLYTGTLANAWCRSTSVSGITCKVMVIDTRTNAVVKTVTVTPTGSSGTEVSGLSTYYNDTLMAYLYSSEGHLNLRLTATEDMKCQSLTNQGNNYYTSNYSLAVQFYPTSGSSVIDVWGGTYNFFTDFIPVSGYTWTNGSDDMSANDFSNNDNIIVVGSYVSRQRSGGNSLGDISKFSSYATPQANLMGKQLPWITAPGEELIAAYNHNCTSRSSSHVVAVDNSNYPYGYMSGTSMAAPCAAGIVALWLQAANECGKTLSLSEVKAIMAETAIRDSWVTSGANASHFGNGKIDALAGIQYILEHYSRPYIIANPKAVSLEGAPGHSYTATVTVSGIKLNGNITATLNDPSGVFIISPTNLGTGGELVITFTPAAPGSYSATVTLTSPDATAVTITLNGTAASNTLLSNSARVPVYKTDIEVLTAYTISELQEDTDHSLPENVTNADVSVKISNDDAITRYDVYHHAGTKASQDNWATGDVNRSVAYAAHSSAMSGYYPYARDENDLTSWVQQPAVTFGSLETEKWIRLNDYETVQNDATWYVPVVVADGVVTTGNTYGAHIRPSYAGSMTAEVNYDQSTVRTDPDNNDAEYIYMTAEVVIRCTAPQVEDGTNYHYECFLARAWRLWTPYIVGVGAGEPIETYMGEKVLNGIQDEATIGCKDFQLVNNQWSLEEPTFCTPANAKPLFISRFYYKRVPNNPTLNAGGDGGEGGGGAGAPGDGPTPPQNPTSLNELSLDKGVTSVTYVNPLGMTSSRPFEGVNIIVTRYTDGSTSTTRVLR